MLSVEITLMPYMYQVPTTAEKHDLERSYWDLIALSMILETTVELSKHGMTIIFTI